MHRRMTSLFEYCYFLFCAAKVALFLKTTNKNEHFFIIWWKKLTNLLKTQSFSGVSTLYL